MQFIKMHSYGNDFVVFGNPISNALPEPDTVKMICDRHYGIGADCAVFIGYGAEADYFMHVFNPDGFEAEMCGNALRCSGVYVSKRGYFKKRSFSVKTRSGVRSVSVDENNSFAEIGNPRKISSGDLILGGKMYTFYEINIGNPHCVVLASDLSDEEFTEYGKTLENHAMFELGTNVEFACFSPGGKIAMRVWERGIGETLSCVTGSCACVKAALEEGITNDTFTVSQKGADITVHVRECGNMFVGGECTTVFSGNTEIF